MVERVGQALGYSVTLQNIEARMDELLPMANLQEEPLYRID